jgi:ATP-dependent DNA helicase RecQ
MFPGNVIFGGLSKSMQRKQIRRLVKDIFGYPNLRPGQEAAIRSILDGRDTLAVMPTGSGKSLIYQLAAMQLDGPTIIISPLIALQRDQVETIAEHGLGEAALVNATLSATEERETFEQFEEGMLEFLYLAPEQFNDEETIQQLKQANLSLFVVDEAHCISEWGHDFRPEYLRLGNVIEELGHPRVLALTATAAPPVRKEILERLKMRDGNVIVQGFDRPNISLDVETFQDETMKRRALIERVQEAEKPGIIYAATRKHAEEVAEALREVGVRAQHYHAGMAKKERGEVQQAFMGDELEVIVATTAFGMGIDKANVRFVFHYDISDSVDSYYQEIGRAGRDGQAARAILFYCPKDVNLQLFLASSGRIETDEVEMVTDILREHQGTVSSTQLGAELDLSQTRLSQILHRLEELALIEIQIAGDVVLKQQRVDWQEVAENVTSAHEAQRQLERSRVEMMRGYAEVSDCRREYILNYFGEAFQAPCNTCDNCLAGVVTEERKDLQPFPINSKVRHKVWGEGLVMRYEEEKMVVLFDSVGYKTLSVEVVVEQELLVVCD